MLADQRQTLRQAVGYAAMHCASINLTDPWSPPRRRKRSECRREML